MGRFAWNPLGQGPNHCMRLLPLCVGGLAGAWRGASSEACAAPGAVLVWAAVRWAEECGGAAPLCWPGGSVCSLHDVRLTWLRMMRLVRSRLIQAGLDRASIVKPASPSGPCSSRPCSWCARSCAQVAMMRQGSRSGTIPWMPHSGHAQAPDLSLCCETLLAFTCPKRPRQRRARGRRTEHERQTPLIRPRHALTGPGSARAHRLTQHHSSHLGMVPLLQAPAPGAAPCHAGVAGGRRLGPLCNAPAPHCLQSATDTCLPLGCSWERSMHPGWWVSCCVRGSPRRGVVWSS